MLTCVKGIGEKTKLKFNELGIFTPVDLLLTLPQRYVDLRNLADIDEACLGEFCKTEITVDKVHKPYRKGRLQIFKAQGQARQKSVMLIWFNQNYISKLISENQSYVFFGKLSQDNDGGFAFVNPVFEKTGVAQSAFDGIRPVYRTKGLISQKVYKELVLNALNADLLKPSLIEENIEKEHGLMPYKKAVYSVHNPQSFEEIELARKRIQTEKLVKRMAAFKVQKQTLDVDGLFAFNKDIDIADFVKGLGFELTSSQKEAYKKIMEKLADENSLNAMLLGDVGSGKTAVAFIICYFVIKNGYQAAFMAPTEILARQHYQNAKDLFEKYHVNVALLTSSIKSAQRKEITEGLKKGEIDLVIGTHSLISEEVEFDNIALAVFDEQHRFGVAQRSLLSEKNNRRCNILTLTATPIPRSLQIAAYGEIDVFAIERRYSSNIKTFVVTKEKAKDMFEYVANVSKKGEKALIIAPRIEDSEGVELYSVNRLYKKLSSSYFKEIKTACLHGKLKEETKKNILDNFLKGRIKILLATSLIEVGIDIPDISVMVIMNAESFGLATLHQLRGRLGRDGRQASCFLYTEKPLTERLRILKELNDGLEIAEYDFKLRGGGDIFGVEQTGKNFDYFSLESIKTAWSIVEKMDLSAMRGILKGEIIRNELNLVSMN
ncbi:MAG: ATP-dependent DNA helicase RecG [Christensenellales bacterium]|jgi:ATP-dependent DNA helicase RecG|nr:ATP-dependent DNA helicase RecG [Clostridiales bacterium]